MYLQGSWDAVFIDKKSSNQEIAFFIFTVEDAALPVSTHYSNDHSFVSIHLWELE